MSRSEVEAILGEPDPRGYPNSPNHYFLVWEEGPNRASVSFTDDDRASHKEIHLATGWETLRWYVAKIGVELPVDKETAAKLFICLRVSASVIPSPPRLTH